MSSYKLFSLPPPNCTQRDIWGFRELIQTISCSGWHSQPAGGVDMFHPSFPGLAGELTGHSASQQCSHKAHRLLACLPNISLLGGCCGMSSKNKSKLKTPLLCEDPHPRAIGPTLRGYKNSPSQDSYLSAQLVLVKLWLRIPDPLMFPTLLSVGQKSLICPATSSTRWSPLCAPQVGGYNPILEVGESSPPSLCHTV